MAWSVADLSRVELARQTADLPILVAGPSASYSNAAKAFNAAPQWRISGSWASGSNIVATDFPTSRVYDDDLTEITKPATKNGTHYLIFDLANVTFDVVGIFVHNVDAMGASGALTVTIADSSDFATNATTLAHWTQPTARRLVSTTLGVTFGRTNPSRYSGVRYMRLKIVTDGTILPIVGEVFLGTRQALPHEPLRGTYDAEQLESDFEEFAAAGNVRRYARSTGRRIVNAEWMTDSADYESLFRDWFARSGHGTKPSLWIPKPSSAPRSAYWMRTDPVLRVAQVAGSRVGRVRLSLRELPPYAVKEA